VGVTRGTLVGSDLSLPGDDQWSQVGYVKSLYIYPVKSMAGVSVSNYSADMTGARSGVLVDRQFMVVDKKGKMQSARKYPNMVLIQPDLSTHGKLTLSYPGKVNVTVDIEALQDVNVECNVWGENCIGVDCGDIVSSWLSDVILSSNNPELRLVYHKEENTSRPAKDDNEYLYPLQVGVKDRPLFADGYPFLMLSQPSLDTLNHALSSSGVELSVEETRFRPNILITGDFPGFAEDKWAHVKIGDTVFRNVKLCTRCNFTTVDPKTGEKNAKGEPLKTLRSFRSTLDKEEKKVYGTSPFFGVNLGVEKSGNIRVNDNIYIKKQD